MLTSDNDFEFWSDDEFLENPGNQIDEIHDKERDLNRTFLEEQEIELCTTFNMDNTIFAPFNSNVKEIDSKLKSMLQAMFKEDMVESDIVNRDRIIVTIEKLIELKGNICNFAFANGQICQEHVNFDKEIKGSVLTLRWECVKKHKGL